MIRDLIYSLRSGAELSEVLPQILLIVICVLIALTFHECAHGFAAYKLGDPTARNFGRLTLDPRKHLDPIGTLCMMLFGFGWAKPVPVNSRYFKKPRRDMAITAIAGPAANFVLSFAAMLFYQIFSTLYKNATLHTAMTVSLEESNSFGTNVLFIVTLFFLYMHTLNLYLAIFNLIPIPPLDGSRLLFLFLPDKYYFGLMKYERIIMIVMLGLLWTGIISLPISTVCNWISDGMAAVIGLIPGL